MANTKLKLYFKDANEGSKQLTIDYPFDSYDPSDLYLAMDQMIESDVIQTKNGSIKTKTKAELETVSKETYEI